ncbi:MAG: hypothetical protein ABUL55_01120 [Pseudomonadota bacterium]
MRNLAMLTVLSFVLSTAPAFAETMDSMYGNTVTVTQPGGIVDRYYFEADGTFTERSHDGATYTGHWVRRAGDVCLTVDQREDCAPVPTDKAVGDSWMMETGGGSIAVAIVAGRS